MTREEAIKTLRELWRETNDNWYEEAYNMALEALKAEAVKGEWIIRDDMPKLDNTYSIECSECGQLMFGHYNADNPNFCCNCGARMKGGAK